MMDLKANEKRCQAYVESFLQGAVPSMAILQNSPRIDDWEPHVDLGSPRDPPQMRIRGRAFGCGDAMDGEQFETQRIIWLDRKFRFALTWATLYALGDRAIPIDGVDL